MDLICGDYRNNMSTEPEAIVGAVRQRLLPEAVIDAALHRLFAARIRLGMFDPPGKVPYSKITSADNDTAAHRVVSLQVARASMVPLRNDGGVLPLKKAPATIAVVGPNADNLDSLLGNYNGTPSKPVTVLAGIRARFPQAKVIYAEGTGLIGPVTAPVRQNALCVDSACKTRGLKAEHFIGTALAGTPTSTGTESNAQLTWSDQQRDTSVRRTGTLDAPESGEYRFGFLSEGGYRIWIGDKLVIEDWSGRDSASLATGSIQLEAQRKYPIKVEAFQRGTRGQQRLVWSLPSQRGDDAVAVARNADLVVFVAGLSARVEGEEMKVNAPGFAGGDRTGIDLPGPQLHHVPLRQCSRQQLQHRSRRRSHRFRRRDQHRRNGE